MFDPAVVTDVTDIREVEQNAKTYADRFIQGRMLAFRNVDWNTEERGRVLWAIGSQLGWGPGVDPQKTGGERRAQWTYNADYSGIMGKEFMESASNNAGNLALSWHLENPCWRFPQVAAGWYMKSIDISPESGQTGFIDVQDLYEKLSVEQQNFVLACELLDLERNHEWTTTRPQVSSIVYTREISHQSREARITFDDNSYQYVYTFPAVQPHITTGEPLLRVPPTAGTWGDLLHKVNGEDPTEEDREKFNKIRLFVKNQTFGGETKPYWWQWNTGDLLIVDLHRSAHAVNAGFSPEKRVFEGIWCHETHEDLCSEPQWVENTWLHVQGDPSYHAR